ncbi:hypothetical protein IWX50DRAFT_641010 [Phyllosticta citricarpa]
MRLYWALGNYPCPCAMLEEATFCRRILNEDMKEERAIGWGGLSDTTTNHDGHVSAIDYCRLNVFSDFSSVSQVRWMDGWLVGWLQMAAGREAGYSFLSFSLSLSVFLSIYLSIYHLVFLFPFFFFFFLFSCQSVVVLSRPASFADL